ncbi:hypothetical protein [Pseudoalteromonas shioyasakiensis]|uniref:hypothetical protein n=1 Tax=Pseudoalteromonas shioyasakiensis TaxID=1190813 RepID=UPI003F7FD8EB
MLCLYNLSLDRTNLKIFFNLQVIALNSCNIATERFTSSPLSLSKDQFNGAVKFIVFTKTIL